MNLTTVRYELKLVGDIPAGERILLPLDAPDFLTIVGIAVVDPDDQRAEVFRVWRDLPVPLPVDSAYADLCCRWIVFGRVLAHKSTVMIEGVPAPAGGA